MEVEEEEEEDEDEDEAQSESVATFRDNTINNRCIDFTHTTRPPGGMNYSGPGFKMFQGVKKETTAWSNGFQWSCSSGPSSFFPKKFFTCVSWAHAHHLFRHVFPKRHRFLRGIPASEGADPRHFE